MTPRPYKTGLMFLSLCLLLTSCISPIQTLSPSNSEVIRPLETASTELLTPLPLPTKTLAATAPQPLPGLTRTFIPITPPSKSPDSTPQPTLEPDHAQSLLLDLLQGKNNKTCRLPCWWGIIPGITEWHEAQSFLETFTQVHIWKESGSFVYASILPPFPEKMGTISHEYTVKEGVVDRIKIYNGDLAPNLYLTNILNTYGPPNEIWIQTIGVEEQGSQPFTFYFFYPENGVLIVYSGGNLSQVGDKLRNCFQDLDSPFIYLWPPAQNISFQDAAEALMNIKAQGPPFPLRLEEATNLDLESFYTQFKDPNNNACLDTPINLWMGN